MALTEITNEAEYQKGIERLKAYEDKAGLTAFDYFSLGVLAGLVLKWEHSQGMNFKDSVANEIITKVRKGYYDQT